MTKSGIKSLLLAAAVAALSGCAGQPVNFGAAVTPEQIDQSKGEAVSASATGFQLLLFIPIAVNGRQQNAYEELQAKAGDRVLTDIKITESWTYAFVGTLYTTKIDAMAYPKKGTGAAQ